MITDLEIEFHLDRLLPELQEKVQRHFNLSGERDTIIIGKNFLEQRRPRKLCYSKGPKYYKLYLLEGGEWGGTMRSVFGFVRKADGAVLRAASWSRPEVRTKTAVRGYINDENALDYFSYHGVVYAV